MKKTCDKQETKSSLVFDSKKVHLLWQYFQSIDHYFLTYWASEMVDSSYLLWNLRTDKFNFKQKITQRD